ncbi:MAG: dihydrolipoyl dehydrogenase [Candidatus Eremiobacteraeota bacterium]|nr:dihydrolipoyl dehydrogenase [Candidatus Eremiobacteraeota bacterium]
MEQIFDFDLLIIGSGTGGYVAAIRASQLGLKTAVVEKDKPGGVCLNWGCIPSKSLIHQAETYGSIHGLEKMGLKVDVSGFDYCKVYKKSRKTSETLSRGITYLLNKNNIEFIKGEAKIVRNHEIIVNGEKKITGKNIIVATGSRAREIPSFPIDEDTVLSSTGALMMQELPETMLILGAGAIGVEFAHIFNAFGVKIHLVEMLDQILPLEDAETAAVLNREFRKRKIKIYTGTKASSMEKKDDVIEVVLEAKDGKQKIVEVEKILVAVGRTPNSENLGLENVGIKTDRGFIPVGDYYKTVVPEIFAVGDVIESSQLAHVASKEGEIAVEYMAGLKPESRIDPDTIPGAVYCEPQVGSFGPTESKLQETEVKYEKFVFPYRGAGKSVAIEKPAGLAKVLVNPDTHEILGASVVGAEATEIIHELLLAKSAKLLPRDIAEMIHAHPTLSEVNMELMRGIEGWAIHV